MPAQLACPTPGPCMSPMVASGYVWSQCKLDRHQRRPLGTACSATSMKGPCQRAMQGLDSIPCSLLCGRHYMDTWNNQCVLGVPLSFDAAICCFGRGEGVRSLLSSAGSRHCLAGTRGAPAQPLVWLYSGVVNEMRHCCTSHLYVGVPSSACPYCCC